MWCSRNQKDRSASAHAAWRERAHEGRAPVENKSPAGGKNDSKHICSRKKKASVIPS